MKITFLGTSAANAYPEAFCSCQNCVAARRLGGPSLRKRSAALINHDLLIDLGPDIMAASQMHRIPLYGVRYCIQTHAHADHLDPSHLLSRSPGFGVRGAPKLNFYGSAATVQKMAVTFQRDLSADHLLDPDTGRKLNLEIHTLTPMQPIVIGEYRVTPIPANHDANVESLLYAVETKEHSLFYGTDTAVFSEEIWRGLHNLKQKFDLVVLDHTYGPDEIGTDHLSAVQLQEHVARMKREGLLKKQARILATHIAHEGNPPHPDLEAYAHKHGYEIAYDGLIIDLGTDDGY